MSAFLILPPKAAGRQTAQFRSVDAQPFRRLLWRCLRVPVHKPAFFNASLPRFAAIPEGLIQPSSGLHASHFWKRPLQQVYNLTDRWYQRLRRLLWRVFTP
jgi:hypothetical protein